MADRINQPLHTNSPLLPSKRLSELCGRQVLLKMENLQPSGSFKIRGMGLTVQKAVSEGCKNVICSSGGNAGMSAAYAAQQMGVKATIVIPESTPKFMISQIRDHGAQVIVHGGNWNEAHEKALELAKVKDSILVHPFDHPDVWEGHSSLVDEVLEHCSEKPAAFVVSVGGGGLLCGVFKGLHRHNLQAVPVVASETQGAHCYSEALKAGAPVKIADITSVAKTLGSLSVTAAVFDLRGDIPVINQVIPDKEAIDACVKFLDDHRMLVEPSCGAALAMGYSGYIKKFLQEGKIPAKGPVIFVVCGGNVVTAKMMEDWNKLYLTNS